MNRYESAQAALASAIDAPLFDNSTTTETTVDAIDAANEMVVSEAFAALINDPALLKAISASGYTVPTPVQAAAIPAAIAGRDLIVSAQTGSGKTAAFMLPSLQRLSSAPIARGNGPRVLVIAPTRELADQSSRAALTYGKFLPRLSVLSIVGGMPYREQLQRLSRPVDVLIATPGRLLDHLERGRLNFDRLELLILDEADRMLDMGFIEDIETIVRKAPATRQTLLFSATLAEPIERLARQWMKSPERISISASAQNRPDIEERFYPTDDVMHKGQLLEQFITDAEVTQMIIFIATKRDADMLADQLEENGFPAQALHGDMDQRARTRTINKMRRGDIRILVATDVAARGIDVAGISHVINWDLPMHEEDYVHRIGRTGRAGRKGVAITFVSSREVFKARAIERFIQREIPIHTMPGLEPRFNPFDRRPGSGGRPSGPPSGGRGRPFKGRPSDDRNSGSGGNSGGGGGYRGSDSARTGYAARTQSSDRGAPAPRAPADRQFADRPFKARENFTPRNEGVRSEGVRSEGVRSEGARTESSFKPRENFTPRNDGFKPRTRTGVR